MKKALPILVSLAAIALALTALRITAPDTANAGLSGAAPLATTATETWNLGITVEGPPTYNAIIGRVVGDVGAFRSNRGVTQMAFIFPAPASARTVKSASLYLLSRTGGYTGMAVLTLRTYDYAGTLQHTVSNGGIELQTAATGSWIPVTLSGTPDDLVISPGEFLAYHFALNGASGGDLDVRPLLEVVVQ